ncbi:hypothetical protein TNCT_7291 [Trichonephila clavata]|uniref:Uncharacterized protein n=1 Tax=Trichonephila clavata TaxID=2740835 RepID=A0A8X6LR34_TRICU|nr:hypothetical protein TNCT_7291 [Trichonephila clavata]
MALWIERLIRIQASLDFTIAESTDNAIPNKKNSQKHVVIVPIDVHHRHDSQVSQILNPDKASDITKAQQKNLEGKKTRMREYRARKNVRIQSTSDSPSVVHHQEDEILQADDNLNKSHEFVGISCQDTNVTHKRMPAERMRDYQSQKKITFNRLVILLQLFIIKMMKFYYLMTI